jgi:hypothetical protein
MATTDIAVIKPGGFVALNQGASEAREIIEELLDGEPLTARDLPVIKVPSGGKTDWEIPGPNGSEYLPKLEGILLHFQRTHQYWENPEPDGTPPQCKSVGPEHKAIGDGVPGGPCHTCPLNRLGTHPKGEGKACTERELWFLLRPNSIMPYVVSLSPTSLGAAADYRRTTLAGVPIRPTSCITTIELRTDTNKAGQKFARAVPRMAGMLDPVEAQAARDYAQQFRPEFDDAVEAMATETGVASDLGDFDPAA